MRVLHLSTSDIGGGAAIAAHRLHQGLQHFGVNSQMLVERKRSDDPLVFAPRTNLSKALGVLKPTLDRLPLRLYRHCDHRRLSLEWLPDGIQSKITQLTPDIINLHWICEGFLKIETLAKLQQPLVWTLHDMWPFTGGCHYNQECDRYTNSCGACPQIQQSQNWDLSRWVWQRKCKAWKRINLTIVTPSHWLANCAKSSSLFKDRRVEVIPNGLDTKQYKPINKRLAREVLNLPQDKQLILFGAIGATSDSRKGFHQLQLALNHLSQSGWQKNTEVVVFGSSKPENSIDLGFRTHYLGYFHDDIALALVYSAANVMIVPSTQEAFGQTASESLACGTPVVCFDSTGLKDIVEHERNGYRAQCFRAEDLAKGIAWVLQDEDRWQHLSCRAREKVEREFTIKITANRYMTLYKEVLNLTRNN
ncbi:MAG: glycosyltransferase family 4 protein [Coleofasciculus sp. G1-WW12-02]|uniref:glycosyltransferase family 4 protein n=1 Tax=Coleofasciculus sp. G1-WW12-02 TaxID=3068483 RepID=UPI0032FA7335